jgi:hypothetical protein
LSWCLSQYRQNRRPRSQYLSIARQKSLVTLPGSFAFCPPSRLMKSAICGNIHHAPIDVQHDIQGRAERRNLCEKDAADHILSGPFGTCRLRARNGTGSSTPSHHHLRSIGIAYSVVVIASSGVGRNGPFTDPEPGSDSHLYAYRSSHRYPAADRHTYPSANRYANAPATDTGPHSH